MKSADALSILFARRSIRKYSGKPVPEGIIREIIRAGMYAPSARNKQPWHFIVINQKDLLRKIMNVHPYAGFLGNASHAVLICGDEQLHNDDGYYVVDCGAATENMLIAAHMLGIGSCWIGIHPRENRKEIFRKLFNLPEHIQPFALISLGHPDEVKPVPERFRPERIHYNDWNK